MESYRIIWKRSASHDLRKIDQQRIPQIISIIEQLADNPFPSQHRKLRSTENFYRIRVGDYRVIYQVDNKARDVIIYYIRHRREAYRKL